MKKALDNVKVKFFLKWIWLWLCWKIWYVCWIV